MVYLRSAKDGCCSISDDLSFSRTDGKNTCSVVLMSFLCHLKAEYKSEFEKKNGYGHLYIQVRHDREIVGMQLVIRLINTVYSIP